jgi:DNA primase
MGDLFEIVSRHVKLKKRGKKYVGICPFHEEKTGSLVVDPEANAFVCFGCGCRGGADEFECRVLEKRVSKQ